MNDKKEEKIIALEETLLTQKERIFELKSQLTVAEKEILKYKHKSDQMSKALISAVNKADEIEQLALQKYKKEMLQLKNFHDRWISYYNKIIKKYPINDELKSLAEFNNKMNDIVGNSDKQSDNSLNVTKEQKDYRTNNQAILTNPKQQRPYISDIEDNYVQEKLRLNRQGINKNFGDMLVELNGFEDVLEPISKIKNYISATENFSKEQATTRDVVNRNSITISNSDAKNEKSTVHQQEYNNKTIQLDYQEAQNPKEGLEDIMKDLGLM